MSSRILLFFILFFNFLSIKAEVDISLSGKWKCRLDSLSIGEKEHWERDVFSTPIVLPGSTDEAGIGNSYPISKSILGCNRFPDYPQNADFGMMTRKHKYIGKVWYQKEFTIKANQTGMFTLFLERVMWRSKVWIDGNPVKKIVDYLSSPHKHFLGQLDKGKHTVTIMIDNSEIYPIGTLGHSYCPHMQTQWNGVVGEIGLQKTPVIHIDQLNVYPSYCKKEIRVLLNILNSQKEKGNFKLTFTVTDKQTGQKVYTNKQIIEPSDTINNYSFTIPLPLPKPWDEFTPNLYKIDVLLNSGKITDRKTSTFGFRDLGIKDKHFTINNKKIIYRNSHEGMFFSNTGYPNMSVDYWKNIWLLYKKHGFNAVRFHSCCPPKAAFIAADEVGLYLQIEFFWKDGWMGWKDLIGEADKRLNQFVFSEVLEALKTYGNHPSMMLVSFGNELGGNFDWMGERIKEMKNIDTRHWYAAGIAHNITVYDDYVEYGGKNQALNNKGTDWNYSDSYNNRSAHNYDERFRRKNLPEFTHETGQYLVHPLWNEIEKYTGILAPLNLKYYKSIAQRNGIDTLDEKLQKASGQINKNLYKAEIEATLRTPESAGYSLLSMVDYPGQGEALVGWVNAFYENKNFITPEEFSMFGSHTVPLLRYKKYVWEDGEIFTGGVEISNFGKESLHSKKIFYNIKKEDKVIDSGYLYSNCIEQGELTKVGFFNHTLHSGTYGCKLDIELEIENTSYNNKWSIWVFPKRTNEVRLNNVIETNSLKTAIAKLKEGKKVLLLANNLGNKQNQIYSAFNPVFWSATWFTGQNTDVSGAYIRNKHPLLSLFPTEDVMNWQWEDICEDSRGFILNDFPKDYYPIVQPVNDFHHGNKLGTIFELKTREGGKLVVCGYNLTNTLDKRIAARQLRETILSYMNSENFKPTQFVEYDWLNKNLKSTLNNHEKEIKELKALLFITPDNTSGYSQLSKWTKKKDNVITNEEDLDYHIDCQGVWQDDMGSYWVGNKIILEIKIEHPKLMTLKLCFLDSNKLNRTGVISCEDAPEVQLKEHHKETWISIPITRENCLDGKIKVAINCLNGPNIMLNKIALTAL